MGIEVKEGLLVYLAGPYTHKSKRVREYRFQRLTKASALLILQHGYNNFSPITQSHLQALHEELPGTWNFWQQVDIEYLKRCDILVVLRLPGWDKSVGVAAEISYMKATGKPIWYADLDEAHNTLIIEKE